MKSLQSYLSLPPAGFRTIAGWKAYRTMHFNANTNHCYVEYCDRLIEGLRKARMPEG
jgi:hypothetical protein